MSSTDEHTPRTLTEVLRKQGKEFSHTGKNDEADLISASKALSMFPRNAIDNDVARKLLIAAAAAGTIEVACDIIIEELHVRPIRMNPPSNKGISITSYITSESGVIWLQNNLFIPKKSPTPLFKPAMFCNWKKNVFAIIRPKISKPIRLKSGRVVCEPFTRTVLYGVKFSRSGVTTLLRKYRNGDLAESPTKKFRKAAVRYNWTTILKDLIAEAQSGRLSAPNISFGEFGFQAALEERILNLSIAISDSSEGMSVSTARRQAVNLIEMNRASLVAAQRKAIEPDEPYGSDGPI